MPHIPVKNMLLLLLLISTLTFGFVPDAKAQRPSLKLAYIFLWPCSIELIMAEELGYFKQVGVDVEVLSFSTGAAATAALVGGSIDAVYLGGVLGTAPPKGIADVFLVLHEEINNLQVVAWPGEGIRPGHPEDLKGKTIACTKGTSGHYMINEALKKGGLTIENVELINADMPAVVSGFITHGFQAMGGWKPYVLQAQEGLKKQGVEPVIVAEQKDYPHVICPNGFMAPRDLLRNPAKREAFILATMALLMANDHIQGSEKGLQHSFELATQKMKGTSVEIHKESWRSVTNYKSDEVVKLSLDGTFNKHLGMLQKLWLGVGAGGLTKYVEPETYVDWGIVQEASKRLKETATRAKNEFDRATSAVTAAKNAGVNTAPLEDQLKQAKAALDAGKHMEVIPLVGKIIKDADAAREQAIAAQTTNMLIIGAAAVVVVAGVAYGLVRLRRGKKSV